MSDSQNGQSGETPPAWVWSHYRGELPETAPPPGLVRASKSETPPTPRPVAYSAAPKGAGPSGGAIAFIVALAILTLAGATWWLAASRPQPAEAPAAPQVEESEAPPRAAPPHVGESEASPAESKVAAPSEPEAPPPAPPAAQQEAAPPPEPAPAPLTQQEAAPAAEPPPPAVEPAPHGAKKRGAANKPVAKHKKAKKGHR